MEKKYSLCVLFSRLGVLKVCLGCAWVCFGVCLGVPGVCFGVLTKKAIVFLCASRGIKIFLCASPGMCCSEKKLIFYFALARFIIFYVRFARYVFQ